MLLVVATASTSLADNIPSGKKKAEVDADAFGALTTTFNKLDMLAETVYFNRLTTLCTY